MKTRNNKAQTVFLLFLVVSIVTLHFSLFISLQKIKIAGASFDVISTLFKIIFILGGSLGKVFLKCPVKGA